MPPQHKEHLYELLLWKKVIANKNSKMTRISKTNISSSKNSHPVIRIEMNHLISCILRWYLFGIVFRNIPKNIEQ